MQQIELIEAEKEVLNSDDKRLQLTTKRIRYESKNNITSILLCNISSVNLYHRVIYYFIALMVASLLLSILFYSNGEDEIMFICIALAFVFLLLFFKTRKHRISISSKGGDQIFIPMDRMSKEKGLKLINDLEKLILEL